MEFTIQPLMKRSDDNTLKGPMSPVLFAQEMCKHNDHKMDNLFRVYFTGDNEMHQIYEGQGKTELTGHDTLIVKDRDTLMMYVDTGTSGVPSALWSDNEVTVTPVYKRWAFEKKLTEEQMQSIFEYILKWVIDGDNMKKIACFSFDQSDEILAKYENDGRWEDVAFDIDGHLTLFKEM